MRVSSVVAVLALAAPRIVFTSRSDGRTKGFALADQRAVLALPLCAFSLSGLHRGSEATRLGDTLYSTLALLGAVYVCATGGIESDVLRPDDVKTRPHRRQTVSGLCAALFVYVGLRGVRSAFVAANEVPEHTVAHSVGEQVIFVAGDAQISLARVLPLAFGHGTLVCVGALIGTSEHAHVVGSSAVAFEVGMAGIASTVAALWATLAHSEIVNDVPVLYGPHACAGARELCTEAYASRRFAEVNASEASLWLAALAAMIYAWSIEAHAIALTRAEQLFSQQGFGSGALLFFAAFAALYAYGSLDGASWYVDACVGVVLAAIFVSAFGGVVVGALLAAIAFGELLYQLDEDHGTERLLQQGSGTLLMLSWGCLVVYVALDQLVLLLQCGGYVVCEDGALMEAKASAATAGTSLSFLLFVGSAIALAGTSGGAPVVCDASGARTMVLYVALHYLPLLAWIPVYTHRCGGGGGSVENAEDAEDADWADDEGAGAGVRSPRVSGWLASVVLAALLQLLVALQLGLPDTSGVEVPSAALASVAGVACWYVAAYV